MNNCSRGTGTSRTPGIGYDPDPAFGRASDFYPPISVRLGARFSF